MDLVSLKLKYAKTREKELKGEYQRMKTQLRRDFQSRLGPNNKKFRRIVQRIKKQVEVQYRKGIKKIEERVKQCKERFEPKQATSGISEWCKRIATGNGSKRERIKQQVPVYGNIQPPLDEDELNAARLSPKHLLFPVVKTTDARLVSSIGNHKIRWDRAKRIFVDGEEVEEEGETQKNVEVP